MPPSPIVLLSPQPSFSSCCLLRHAHTNSAASSSSLNSASVISCGSISSINHLNLLHSHHTLVYTPQIVVTLHRSRAHETPRCAPSVVTASSTFQPASQNSITVALGRASAQGEKLGAAVRQTLEGLHILLTGGNKGGHGRGGSNGNGDSGGEGDMDGIPETEGASDCLVHDEDGEAEEPEQAFGEERLALSKLDAGRDYLCSEVEVVDMEGMILVEDPSTYEILGITPGGFYRKIDLEEAQSRLFATGWYKHVNLHWVPHSGDAIKVTVLTGDAVYCRVSSFQCINVSSQSKMAGCFEKSLSSTISPPCLIPKFIQTEITMMLQKSGEVSKTFMSHIQERIEDWYHKRGYVYAKVKSFRISEVGALECHVDEGNITQIFVSCVDENGQATHCHTNPEIILRMLPLAVREGMQYNAGACKAVRNKVEQLGLFEKVSLSPAAEPECDDRRGTALHILVKELPLFSASISPEWSFLSNDAGRPTLRTLQPGGTLCVQHRNINGLNRSVFGSVTTSNIQSPQDDLRFKLEYVHPYIRGLQNPHNSTLRLVAFNKRKLSATCFDVEDQVEVPAVWIDRAGVKACVTEKLSRQSKLEYGLAVEEVATRDDAGTICNRRGGHFLGINSPKVRLRSSGVDHVAFLQMKIVRSNLKSGQTGLIGARDIFQVDQGLGLGTHAPVFNRHQLAMTRYIPLQREILPADQLPSVAVVHARYGGCMGDVSSYRSFTNGGPYSLRGHNLGELAHYSRYIEVAGEVRVPVQQLEAYGFFESMTNLQNFGAILKSPGTLSGRVGKGFMYGAGMKMGNLRVEYVIDCNDQTGSLKVFTGERY